MMIMCVIMIELLCQMMMEQISVLEYIFQLHVGACGYVLSCLTLNGLAIRGPRLSGNLFGTQKPPDVATGEPDLCRTGVRGGVRSG
jgi:hypothetical protein